jgi:hypothetical protein
MLEARVGFIAALPIGRCTQVHRSIPSQRHRASLAVHTGDTTVVSPIFKYCTLTRNVHSIRIYCRVCIFSQLILALFALFSKLNFVSLFGWSHGLPESAGLWTNHNMNLAWFSLDIGSWALAHRFLTRNTLFL